jgi:hypothetical protein
MANIMRVRRLRRCRSCEALYAGISRLYDISDLDMQRCDNAINYNEDDIEATIIF